MADRLVRNDTDHALAMRYLDQQRPPYTLRIRRGLDRTLEQNKLQRLWLNEASEQLGDQTAEELRAYCKLRFGVPILRAASEEFREKYDRIIKPHPYETKIEMMAEPLDFPVTRLMSTKEKAAYLDAIYDYFSGLGIVLTIPKQAPIEAYERTEARK